MPTLTLLLAAAVLPLVLGSPAPSPPLPTITLQNAAKSGVVMPWVGLGTGGYSQDPSVGYGGCVWARGHVREMRVRESVVRGSERHPRIARAGALAARIHPPTATTQGTWLQTWLTPPPPPSASSDSYPECWQSQPCYNFTYEATKAWLSVGGRRIDAANSYHDQDAVGQAIKDSGIKREDLFILQKIGPSYPLGYQDALDQWADIKSQMGIDYGWPECCRSNRGACRMGGWCTQHTHTNNNNYPPPFPISGHSADPLADVGAERRQRVEAQRAEQGSVLQHDVAQV